MKRSDTITEKDLWKGADDRFTLPAQASLTTRHLCHYHWRDPGKAQRAGSSIATPRKTYRSDATETPAKSDVTRACNLTEIWDELALKLKRFDQKEQQIATGNSNRRLNAPTPKQEIEFNYRADKWRLETSFQSSLAAKFMHEDYQIIMAMGDQVIPLILNRLKTAHEHWFWALKHLAKTDVASDANNPAKAAAMWIKWGKEKGYID